MKSGIRRWIGPRRPRIIAVIGQSREDIAKGIAHARTSGAPFPVWAWCSGDAAGLGGCDRLIGNATAQQILRDLAAVWPALILASWTGGHHGLALKLLPLVVPPFRAVIRNEADDFFPARPGPILAHLHRRARDASVAAVRRLWHLTCGAVLWLRSFLLNSAERAWSFSLAVLAILARPANPLSRAAMRRGDSESSLRHIPACGSASVDVLLFGRAWQRRGVLRAIASDADFIVLRARGETADAAPLIEFARQTGAFSVARQIAYAGWRRTVVSRHPFRRLQPAEAAEVLAPWSTLIVIRRDLLLDLGIPHAVTTGAALAVLHWKAAAAGLKSLVLGHVDAITQEPGMELEDAEFVVRLLTSPALRRLMPMERRLRRGNVASSPAHRRPLRDLPRVLVVSPYLPFPLSHGGAVRIFNLCRALAHRVDFILVAGHEADETICYDELHEVFREVYAVDRDEKPPALHIPAQVAEYRNSAMTALIRHLCAARAIDILQLEYTQMAEFRDCVPRVPAILVEHDITFTLHEQLANANPSDRNQAGQCELWRSFERRALQSADAVWTMSDRDNALAIRHGANPATTVVVPNGADLMRFHPLQSESAERTILFVGSFRHLPNLLAYEALMETIMPAVWRRLPEVRLHVIGGPDAAKWAVAARKSHLLHPDPRVYLQGFVEDVRPAYRNCAVVAIPLPVSAGTNIKLMEAMACGRAVVSTPVGCQGLGLVDGLDLLIRENGPAFADALVRLLLEDRLRSDIAVRARQTAEAGFGWQAIAERACRDYSRLTGRSAMAARTSR